MKIALIILHADPARGGAERYTIDLAAALITRGHEITLISSSPAPQMPPGVSAVLLRASGTTRVARYRHFLDALDEHLAEQKNYDIVHAMLPVRQCDLYHPHAGLAVATVANDRITALFNPRRRAMAKVERKLLATHSPLVLCLSELIRADVQKYYPLDLAHLPILFNAVDTQKFHPATNVRSDERITGLMIAQDFERKGLAQAILALATIDDHRLRLRVVGKQDATKYAQLATQLGIASRISFDGALADTSQAYRDADFFLLPTKYDPCSLVVLEALASGLPVISTKQNGACEIMTDGVHGFVLEDASDTAALSRAMTTMLDEKIRRQMSLACEALRPKLSFDSHVDHLLTLYEQARGAA